VEEVSMFFIPPFLYGFIFVTIEGLVLEKKGASWS